MPKVSFKTKDGKKVSFNAKSKKSKKKTKSKSKSSPTKNKKKGGKKTAKSKDDKPKKRKGPKNINIRLTNLVRFTIDYSIAAGHPPGPVIRALIMDLRAGGGQTLDLILGEFLAVYDNVEKAPVNTIGRLAGFEWFWWTIVKPNLPKRKLFQIGKICVYVG